MILIDFFLVRLLNLLGHTVLNSKNQNESFLRPRENCIYRHLSCRLRCCDNLAKEAFIAFTARPFSTVSSVFLKKLLRKCLLDYFVIGAMPIGVVV